MSDMSDMYDDPQQMSNPYASALFIRPNPLPSPGPPPSANRFRILSSSSLLIDRFPRILLWLEKGYGDPVQSLLRPPGGFVLEEAVIGSLSLIETPEI